MSSISTDLACIGESLEKIRHIIHEYPQEAQCLLDEQPEMLHRIQELVSLLRELEGKPVHTEHGLMIQSH